MLSSHERLAARQGQYGTPRREYLQELVLEYQRSPQWLRREEIIANLANFAYDPINYPALRELCIMELFVTILAGDRTNEVGIDGSGVNTNASHGVYRGQAENAEAGNNNDNSNTVNRRSPGNSAHPKALTENEKRSAKLTVSLAMGGICNCVSDPALQMRFITIGGVALVLPYVRRIASTSFIRTDAASSESASSLGTDATSSENGRDPGGAESIKIELNTALSALTICFFLLDSGAFAAVTDSDMRAQMVTLTSHPNVQVANIASVFLSRYQELLYAP